MKTFALGQTAYSSRVVTDGDVSEYVALSGDRNPLYDAAKTPRRVPQGLIGGMFSDLLGTKLPGRGTNWLKQRLEFPEPAFVGEALIAAVEIVRIREEKQLINLETTCMTESGRVVCKGEALVLVKEMAD